MPKLLPTVPGATPPRPGTPAAEPKSKMDNAAEAATAALGWLDERTALSGTARFVMFRKVPKGTNWFYTLGTSTMFAFMSQVITGVILAMYYDPSPNRAYESMRYINNDVWAGQFVHGMHRWGATVMVIFIFLHMGRTFFFGAYKYPRELNWVIGVLLVLLVMIMAFTGYLLPWDQRAYWATAVGVNIFASAPIAGPYLGDFLRAGPDFGATTLSRFYSIHMLLLPGLIIGLIGAHLYLVIKHGTTAPPWVTAELDDELRSEEV